MNFHRYPNTYIGELNLLVKDLHSSTKFYTEIIGFQLLHKTDATAVFSADGATPLLTLEQNNAAKQRDVRSPGLYHFALLLPERTDLAKALLHLLQSGYPLQGASDHWVSEALYLADPDGNGIEIYADRPADNWEWENGLVKMTTQRLDAENLLAEINGGTWNGLPSDTVIGHIHLQVANLHDAESFYCNGLGFEVVTRYGARALFVATGGYHHHIGLNTWNSAGSPPAVKDSLGLKHYTLLFPSRDAIKDAAVRLKQLNAQVQVERDGSAAAIDPFGIKIIMKVQE
ncbi:VOC family protein [Peribacillus sp. SCS-155]|uniref:VOC family protein n=1 Tax=Peribacillus sedimenti TaxID=3115297 RepID=UPI003906BD65